MVVFPCLCSRISADNFGKLNCAKMYFFFATYFFLECLFVSKREVVYPKIGVVGTLILMVIICQSTTGESPQRKDPADKQ